MQVMHRGQRSASIAEARTVLASIGLLDNTDIARSDLFDEALEFAVRHFQQRRGLSVDGLIGAETYAGLQAARFRLGDRVLAYNATTVQVGDDVAALQTQLLELGYDLVRGDGVFGGRTQQALQAFQRDYGLQGDGICGPVTLRALRQLGRRIVGGRPQLLREQMAVADAGPSLLDKRIVIDPGHGGDDAGVRFGALTERDLVWDLATRLEGRLAAIGVRPWLTRGRHTGASDAQRAGFANDLGADLVVSLHVDAADRPQPNGVAVYYFGGAEVSSSIGEHLAGLASRELVSRTGLLDLHTHAKSWSLLRLTRMPAVRVEVGYLSHPADRARLQDPLFRDTVSEGLLVAIQRLYLPGAEDPPTGVMRIPAVAG